MMRLLLITLMFPFASALAEEPQTANMFALTAENYTAWRDHILPTETELSFQSLPWHLTFAEGLEAAAEANKPLFLWTMNGHPLGCT